MASVAEWTRRLSVAQETTGSNPVARPNPVQGVTLALIVNPVCKNNAPVAQWTEHWASDPGVAGSSPAGRTIRFAAFAVRPHWGFHNSRITGIWRVLPHPIIPITPIQMLIR